MAQGLEDFWKRASWDAVLQARLRTVRSDSTAAAIADLVRIGQEFGFRFTDADYRASLPGAAVPVVQAPAPVPQHLPPPLTARELNRGTSGSTTEESPSRGAGGCCHSDSEY